MTLNDSASSRYSADSGVKVNYETFTFRVPAGQARLDVAIAYAASPATVAKTTAVGTRTPKRPGRRLVGPRFLFA